MPIRRALDAVAPYRPQPPLEVLQRRLGLERIVKLASNEGAFGPTLAAAEAFASAAGGLARYPEAGAGALREALADRHRVSPAQVVVGNGADELIRLCAVVSLDPGDRAVHPWPSFPSYGVSAACCGATAVAVPLGESGAPDLDALLGAVRERDARLVYVAVPNNPTGAIAPPEDLRAFVDALGEGVLCVLDEAYAEYADAEPGGPALVREGRAALCVLRTFSKVHGLAALRIGYAIAAPEVADALDRVRPVFNVNGPAQAAALASLGARREVAVRVAHARAARGRIAGILTEAGLDPLPSQANFVYATVPGGDGQGLADALLGEGVIVRALGGFGAPESIRVTCGTDAELDALEGALSAIADAH